MKLLIVRAGRASALALALANRNASKQLPFYTGPGSDGRVSAGRLLLAGADPPRRPYVPPASWKIRPLSSSLFLFSEARNTQRERERRPGWPPGGLL